MSEAPSAARTPFDPADTPITRRTLADDLRRLGMEPGAVVLVHAALSKLGWVFGKTQAVIEALLDAVGPDGTIMMPTHTGDLTDPALYRNPPVPAHWIDVVRAEMPAFDPARTPSRLMGALAEHFRRWPGALRSDHPYGSFAAVGPAAPALTEGHALEDAFGEASPIGALNRLGGQVLLLGVGHGNDTSLHLAEYRAEWPSKAWHDEGSPILVDGERRWATYRSLAHDEDDFVELGAAFEAAHPEAVRVGCVGKAEARLLEQVPMVDFATEWMNRNRT